MLSKKSLQQNRLISRSLAFCEISTIWIQVSREKLKVIELSLFLVYKLGGKKGVSFWKIKSTRENTMTQDNQIDFITPPSSESFRGSLTKLVRQGALQLITQAVEAELTEFLVQYQDLRTESGHLGVVRNCYLHERSITTGMGEVLIQMQNVKSPTAEPEAYNLLAPKGGSLIKRLGRFNCSLRSSSLLLMMKKSAYHLIIQTHC